MAGPAVGPGRRTTGGGTAAVRPPRRDVRTPLRSRTTTGLRPRTTTGLWRRTTTGLRSGRRLAGLHPSRPGVLRSATRLTRRGLAGRGRKNSLTRAPLVVSPGATAARTARARLRSGLALRLRPGAGR
ncbi:MAG: hypothetical protein ACYC6I_06065, partial [Bacillota bacterium]